MAEGLGGEGEVYLGGEGRSRGFGWGRCTWGVKGVVEGDWDWESEVG